PLGQPNFDVPMGQTLPFNMQQALSTLASTLNDDSYAYTDGHTDIEQLGGMVDVMLYCDTKLSLPDFHDSVTKLCQEFEAYKEHPSSNGIKSMQETLKSLGAKQAHIPNNQYIEIIASQLSHIQETIHAD
ncbi:MAG: hypothetical protein KDK44_02905, partial [Chlamydiia bacterium]|nr:hypothetical protein [Chlamydiia bacterium]